MCGGVAFNLKGVPKAELAKFYSEEEVRALKKKGGAECFFWDKRPVLPVVCDGRVKLKDWGNRDKKLYLPITGWAKKESVDAGRWEKYKPKLVDIPAKRGFEKGVWFDFKDAKTSGLLVGKKDAERVYIITKKADNEYRKITGHDRMPLGQISDYEKSKR